MLSSLSMAYMTPYAPTKDLRTPSIEQKRFRTRQNKYYSFQGVKPGQLNAPHYIGNLSPLPWSIPANHSELPIKEMSKRELYQEAQEYPRPPKYRKGRDKRYRGDSWTQAYDKGKVVKRSVAREVKDWHMQAWNHSEMEEDVKMDVSTDYWDIWWVFHPETFEYQAEVWEDIYVWEDYAHARGEKDADNAEAGNANAGNHLLQEPEKDNIDEQELVNWTVLDFGDDLSDCGSDFELI